MTAPEGPETFAFTSEHEHEARVILAKYPVGYQASAVLPLLDLAQRQSGGWLPRAAMDYVAAYLSLAPIRVYEVATFYTMFHLEPVGRHVVEVCTTTPCWLAGSDGVAHACKKRLGIGFGETTPDGEFTLHEVECLGACVNAPMMKVDDDYFEDLDPDSATAILDALARGEPVTPGSAKGRQGSCPEGGPTTRLTTTTTKEAP